MITIQGFWMDRDKAFAEELTKEIRENAIETVARVNRVLSIGGFNNHDEVASGWRPKTVNERTSNAGANSRHIYGQAVDVVDRDRELATWLFHHLDVIRDAGLWMEHPDWTWSKYGNHWVHLQIVPPKSGRHIFIPSSAPRPAPLDQCIDTGDTVA